MGRIDGLEEGWEYCNCHPETCSHFNGVRYVGVPKDKSAKDEPFNLDEKELKEFLTKDGYVSAKEAFDIFSSFGVSQIPLSLSDVSEVESSKTHKKLHLSEDKERLIFGYSHQIGSVGHIKLQVRSTGSKVFWYEAYMFRYKTLDVCKVITNHLRANRKRQFESFLNVI
jgi:hypothetical protein